MPLYLTVVNMCLMLLYVTVVNMCSMPYDTWQLLFVSRQQNKLLPVSKCFKLLGAKSKYISVWFDNQRYCIMLCLADIVHILFCHLFSRPNITSRMSMSFNCLTYSNITIEHELWVFLVLRFRIVMFSCVLLRNVSLSITVHARNGQFW